LKITRAPAKVPTKTSRRDIALCTRSARDGVVLVWRGVA
jgi:hypothetical protein